MATNFFNDINLNYIPNVLGNYELLKINELYNKINSLKPDYYSTEIRTPYQIGGDEVCLWIDPSNRNYISLNNVNDVVMNTSPFPFAVADKSQYGNNYILPLNPSGLSWDPNKGGMLKHVGGALESGLVINNLVCKHPNHFSTVGSPFSFFFVCEPNPTVSTAPNNRAIWQMGSAGNNRPSCIIGADGAPLSFNYFSTGSGGQFQKSSVAHPARNSILGKKHIIGFVYGKDSQGFDYKDMYYNGIFCSRSGPAVTGVTTRSQAMKWCTWEPTSANKFEGWTGEQIMFSRALTRTEVIELCNYLNAKWNVYSPRECDIFVCAGQSNMVGRGDGNGLNPGYTSLQTNGSEYGYYCDPNSIYTISETPIACHRGVNGGNITWWTTTNDTNTGTATLVSVDDSNVPNAPVSRTDCLAEFADTYYAKTGRYCVFFKAALGGTSILNINEWAPDNASNNLWKRVIDVLPAMKQKLKDNGWVIGKSAVLWHQGELDVGANQAVYLAAITECFNLVVNNFGYDYLFYYILEANGFSRNAMLQYYSTNPKIRSIFDTIVFSANNLNYLNIGDVVHYNTIGQSMMGIEGAKQIAEIYIKDKHITSKIIELNDTKNYEKNDIRFYGSVGNGLNNDTQAFISLFSDNTMTEVFIPAGTYIIGYTGQLSDGVSVSNRTNLRINISSADFIYLGTGNAFNFSDCNNVSFSGKCNIYAPFSSPNIGIRVNNCAVCKFSDISISGLNNLLGNPIVQFAQGFSFDGTTPAQSSNVLENCLITTCGIGLNINTRNVLVNNCIFQRCSNVGVDITNLGGSGVNISNSSFFQNCKGLFASGPTEDRFTVSNCSFISNAFFGIHLRRISAGCSIDNCIVSDTLGDSFFSGYALGNATTLPFNMYNSPPLILTNTINTYGIGIEGSTNVCVSNCTIRRNIYNIALGGVSFSTIDANNFSTSTVVGASTVGHISEIWYEYGGSLNNFPNSHNCIQNNTFNGAYVTNSGRQLEKSIQFYHLFPYGSALMPGNHKIKNNTDGTGTPNLSITSSSTSGTYIIDQNYEEINIDLSNVLGITIQLSAAQTGSSFRINAYTEDSQTNITPRDIQFTPNVAISTAPVIKCGGITYNTSNRTYTIHRRGTYYFNSYSSAGTGIPLFNTFIVTSNVYDLEPTQVTNTSINIDRTIGKLLIVDNIAAARTLTFTNAASGDWGAVYYGFKFKFFPLSTSGNNIVVTNNTGIVIEYRPAGTATVNLSNGSNLTLSGSDLLREYFCYFVYFGPGSPISWIIRQI